MDQWLTGQVVSAVFIHSSCLLKCYTATQETATVNPDSCRRDCNLEWSLSWMNLIHLGTINKQKIADAGEDIKIQLSKIYSTNWHGEDKIDRLWCSSSKHNLRSGSVSLPNEKHAVRVFNDVISIKFILDPFVITFLPIYIKKPLPYTWNNVLYSLCVCSSLSPYSWSVLTSCESCSPWIRLICTFVALGPSTPDVLL